jgi:predicted ATPase/class 3 adenylate cyclase
MTGRPLPTGSVTFLFTDIEGSTRAWELHPDAMSLALNDHDRLLRAIVAKHRGYVFKTVGDAFCCAFTEPSEAVVTAIEAERQLRAQHWPEEIGEIRVRMAIHTGKVVQHGGDYFGPTVNRVARLMSIAHGGQILLSSSTAADLANVTQTGFTLRDLGSHRLKDLKQAETTYQVVAAGLRTDFPALASLDAHPNNLPSQLSSFIGRERELADARRRLAQYRIVTVAGPGGVGKTRLALQLAAEVVQDFTDGVYFIALAPITSGDLVVHALAAALNIVEQPNEPLETTVIRYVGGKKVLLVFDNSEHVLTESATLIKQIVSECPNVRCLVTGREPLHLLGEQVERLLPLSSPKVARTEGDLEACDSSRLFLERARAVVKSDLSLSAEDCALVAEICQRLDGIPLAIELAASRLATMPLRRLADKLTVSILVNRDPTASQRHRTLRDAIEWSYRLLAASEQRVFMALSVFQGGCTIEAVEQVAESGVDDDIGSLVDKSLVQLYVNEDGSSRYRLLEPIAEFAGLELIQTAASDGLRHRHFAFYHALASTAALAVGVTKQDRFDSVDREIGNLRAALNWAVECDIDDAAQLAIDLGIFWRARGSFTEGRAWFARVLGAAPHLAPRLRANLLRQSAGFAAMQDDYAQSTELAQAALTIYRDLGDEGGMGLALHTLAEVAHRQGRLDEAEQLYRETFPHLDAADHLLGKTICLMNEGMIARQKGDFASAETLLQKAGANADLLRDQDVWAQVKIESAWATLFAGDADVAERSFREAFAVTTVEQNLHGACQARLGIATAALTASRTDLALHEYGAALQEAAVLRAQIFVVDAIYGIGAVRALNGELVRAAKCCGLAAKIAGEIKCEPRAGVAYTIATERIQAGLNAEQLALAMSAGATMRPEDLEAVT